ncbi:MAG: type 4a pilus biogenesis protein PilO [Actinomycetota bacterium]
MGDRRRFLIAVGGVVAVLALALFFLVLPKMNQVSSANDQLVQAESQEGTLQSQLAALRQAQEEAPEARETIRRVDQAIPPTADQQGFILLLQNAADQAGVDLFTITPGGPTPDPATGLTAIDNSITVTGSYFAITEFLFDVETLPRAAKVTSLSMAPSGDSATGGGLTGTAAVTIYTTDTSAGPGSTPGPTSGGGTTTAPPSAAPSPGEVGVLQPEGA